MRIVTVIVVLSWAILLSCNPPTSESGNKAKILKSNDIEYAIIVKNAEGDRILDFRVEHLVCKTQKIEDEEWLSEGGIFLQKAEKKGRFIAEELCVRIYAAGYRPKEAKFSIGYHELVLVPLYEFWGKIEQNTFETCTLYPIINGKLESGILCDRDGTFWLNLRSKKHLRLLLVVDRKAKIIRDLQMLRMPIVLSDPAYQIAVSRIDTQRIKEKRSYQLNLKSLKGASFELNVEFKGKLQNYEFPRLPKGDYVLSMWGKAEPLQQHYIALHSDKKIVLNAISGMSLKGRVVDENENAIENAQIWVILQQRSLHSKFGTKKIGELGVIPGPVPPIPPENILITRYLGIDKGFSAKSDASGFYQIDHVPSGRLMLWVEKPGYRSTLTPWRKSKLKMENIVLKEQRQVLGRVVGSDGKAISGVRVYPLDKYGNKGSRAITKKDGRFRLAFDKAIKGLRFEHRLYPAYEKAIRGDAQKTLTIVLMRAAYIKGRVQDYRTAMSINVFSVQVDEKEEKSFHHTQGEFSLPLSVGKHHIVFKSEGYASYSQTIRIAGDELNKGKWLRIDLHGAGTIKGHIYNRSGYPQKNLEVRCGKLKARTNTKGEFLLNNIPEGNPILEVSYQGLTHTESYALRARENLSVRIFLP